LEGDYEEDCNSIAKALLATHTSAWNEAARASAEEIKNNSPDYIYEAILSLLKEEKL